VRDYVDDLLALEISTADDFAVESYYTHYPVIGDQEVIWTLDHFWEDRNREGFTETF
jgi:predicted phosphoribosyltransferase